MARTIFRSLEITGLVLALAVAGCQSDLVTPGPTVTSADEQVTPDFAAHAVTGSATGSAHLTVFPPSVPPGLALRNFAFTALKTGDGTVSGQWQIVAGGTILHGPIDCLTIAPDGKSARISGLVTDAKFALFAEGTAFAMELFDNSPGGSGDPDVTTQLRAFRNAAPEVGRAFCEAGTVPEGADLDPLPSEHGNVTIHLNG